MWEGIRRSKRKGRAMSARVFPAPGEMETRGVGGGSARSEVVCDEQRVMRTSFPADV
jgi:hypothetical protein